jgi:sec-independent protein translocase protein TatA
MLQNIGSTEIIIICVILLLLFGGKRIPEFVRSLGQSVREFRSATKSEDEEKDA